MRKVIIAITVIILILSILSTGLIVIFTSPATIATPVVSTGAN